MTVHWIDSITLKLACNRVRGRHIYDVLACEIDQVCGFYSDAFLCADRDIVLSYGFICYCV